MAKKNTPQIRVSRFTKAWEQALLSHYLETAKAKNSDGSFGKEDVLSVSGDVGIVNQMEYQGKSFAGASLIHYGVVSTNDVVYTKSPLRYQPYGIVKTNMGQPGIVSALYAVYHPKKTVYAPFIQTYFNLDKRLNAYLIPIVNKGAKNTINVGDDAALLGTVWFPDRSEQQVITKIFSNLDDLILQHQSKLDKLNQLKSSMLSKMFPQGGAEVPEIRFKGAEQPWKKMSASELFMEYADRGHPELPVLSATQESGMIVRDRLGKDVFHEVANEVGYKRVLPGQFVIHLRSFQGGFAHSAIEGITSPAYTVFGLKEPQKHDDLFWKYVFMSKQFIKRLETVTYGIRDGRSISYDEFLRLEFLFPQKAEQSLIGKYLLDLDSLITMQRQELEKLRSLKKGLLEKMFV